MDHRQGETVSTPFGRRVDGRPATAYTLSRPQGITAVVTDHGATVVQLHVPDRAGRFDDVVLGFDAVDGYEVGRNPYFGATVGRVANRVAGGSFDLDGTTYELARNEGPHHLHGGERSSLDKVLWDVAEHSPDTLVLTYVSTDGEEGYPGTVEVVATFQVTTDALLMRYQATTDRPTPVDLTNHSYLHLGGHGAGDILHHQLQVLADQVIEVDEALIPTGRLLDVQGTPLDLRAPRVLGDVVPELAATPAKGLDHHFALRDSDEGLRPVARLQDPASGRQLELATDQPGLQVYSGNRLDPPIIGKDGRRYGRHGAICLEAHHYPDALHHPGFPSIVLQPGETYRHTTVYRFSTGGP